MDIKCETPPKRVLVAGVGNIFLGDDSFGVEVVRCLAASPLPEDVRVMDFGIRGFDFARAILDNPEFVILVDTAKRGLAPGTVTVLEPEFDFANVSPQTHAMVPTRAISLACAMGATLRRFRIVTCEPASFGDPQLGSEGLSPPVASAVEEAVSVIESMIQEFLSPCTNSR